MTATLVFLGGYVAGVVSMLATLYMAYRLRVTNEASSTEENPLVPAHYDENDDVAVSGTRRIPLPPVREDEQAA